MAVVFTYGAMVFTCGRDPAMGNFSTVRKWMSPSIRSGGGDLFVYDKDITKDIVTLAWQNMDQTDLANLLAFLLAINGSANPFTFVDPKGNSSSAYFWGPSEMIWTPVDVIGPDIAIELLIFS
jgi:hypothetical protein